MQPMNISKGGLTQIRLGFIEKENTIYSDQLEGKILQNSGKIPINRHSREGLRLENLEKTEFQRARE